MEGIENIKKDTKFAKGNAGRPLGAKGRVGKTIKSKIELALNNNAERLDEELANLTGKDFIFAYAKIAEFVLAKKAEVEVDISDDVKFLAWVNAE